MRRWEWVELGVIAYALLVPAVTGSRPRRGLVGVVLGAAIAVQILVEGFRWQLVPLEVAAVATAAGDAFNDERRVAGLVRARRIVLAAAVLAGAAAAPLLLPVPDFGDLPGPFAVGTVSVTVVDLERAAVEGGSPRGGRAVPLQAWYPASALDGADPGAWEAPGGGVVAEAAAIRTGLPAFLFSNAGRAPAHAFAGAAPLSGRFPVIVYVHPAAGFREIAVDLVEGLASQGYVVVAADHPPLAIAARYPDGETVGRDGSVETPNGVDAAADAASAEDLAAEAADDVLAIVSAVSAGPEGPFGELGGHLDAERMGVVGHGIGGAAALRACILDPRCDAVAGLDARAIAVPDRVVARELPVPAMLVRTGESLPDEGRLRGLAERSPSIAYWVVLPGTVDGDLTALGALTPLGHRLGLTGENPVGTTRSLLGRELVAFFDRHLAGTGGDRLDDPPPAGVEREIIP